MITESELPGDLVQRAMQLPIASREKLGHMLLESISVKELLKSRIEQLQRGEVELLDADDVIKEIEARYGADE